MATADTPPYLSEGIIAYIGNKRRLLGLIGDAVARAAGRQPAGRPGSPLLSSDLNRNLEGLNFVDLFAGSGVVSRYARFQGMQVTANDWEPYARVLARAWLEPRPEDISRLFGGPDGLKETISTLNSLDVPEEDETYLARFYAPASDNPDEADYRRERLFYTRSNALKLDAARNYLEKEQAPQGLDADQADLRLSLLLAPQIYAAATNVNTSGVFKAFHRGFGGHGKDALGRITAPVNFKAPIVIDAPRGRTFSLDAGELASSGAIDNADIVYLDPPYNQHQYGSNYHLLNTLVRWDRIPEPLNLGADGRLLRKAGIRRDWTETRSPYCSRKTAESEFAALLDNLKAPLLLLSYSTDGIIPFDSLRRICEDYGRLTLMANPYVTYRGGRQSVNRRDRNLEFVLIVEKGRKTVPADRNRLDSVLIERRLQLAMNDFYRPEILRSSGKVRGEFWEPGLPGGDISISTMHLVRLSASPDMEKLSAVDARELMRLLEEARCRSRDEELEVIEDVWADNPGNCRDLIRQVPRILRKMAHQKYRKEYEQHLKTLKELGRRHSGDFSLISVALEKVEEVARRRFAD